APGCFSPCQTPRRLWLNCMPYRCVITRRPQRHSAAGDCFAALAMTGDAVIARSAATRQSRTAPQSERLLRSARNDRGCCHCEERSAAAIPDGAAPTGGRLLRCARNDRGCCHCEERSDAAIPDG